jgi:pimeloyl-ACP methyl ester carboxylesterase
MTLQRAYISTSYGQIHYRFGGNGEPLILLHPSPRSSKVFEKLIIYLSQYRYVLAPDTLGFGCSDSLPENVTMEILAESMIEFISSLSLDNVSIFGLHTGNKIASAIGLLNNKRIQNIHLCGMSHSIVLDNKSRNYFINTIVNKYLSNEESKLNSYKKWSKTFRSISNAWWSEKILENNEVSNIDYERAEDEAVDFIRSRNSFDHIYKANFMFDFEFAIKNISIPTQVIELVSEREKHIGPQGKTLVEAGKNISLATLNDSMTGVMSVGGRNLDILENGFENLGLKILDFK